MISLFNGAVPLVGIQMRAYRVGDAFTLIFTKVVDELSRGVIDEDEDAAAAPTDRAYWEKKATKATVELADELFALIKARDPSLELKYNKFYIGLSKAGVAFNFVSFKPKKSWIDLLIRLPEAPEVEGKIDAAGLESLDRDRWGNYGVRLRKQDVMAKAETLRELMELAYVHRTNEG